MACLNRSECNKEYSNMSNSTMISRCLQSNDGWILHGKCQQPRKTTLRACSAIIASFKRLRAIIDGCSDIGIASKIRSAPLGILDLSNRLLMEVFKLFSLTLAKIWPESIERKWPFISFRDINSVIRVFLIFCRGGLGVFLRKEERRSLTVFGLVPVMRPH